MPKWSQNDSILGPFSIKMHAKIDAKIDVEKVSENMRKCSKNDAKMRSEIHEKSMKKQVRNLMENR